MERYSLKERKLLYRILHTQLKNYPELFDSEWLHDLQTDLQKVAQLEGIDIGDHGQWDNWLIQN